MNKIVVLTVCVFLAMEYSSEASVKAVLNVPRASVYAKPYVKSEKVTEALLGDEVRILEEKNGWVYISIPLQRGYKGWLRENNIAYLERDSLFLRLSGDIIVKKPHTLIETGSNAIKVYAGTRLPLYDETEKNYTVILPDGKQGTIKDKKSCIKEELNYGKVVGPDDVLETINYYGSEYRWGGMTEEGMDCSGFVYLIFRVNGLYLERDSKDQATMGMPVNQGSLSPGDLVFFQTRGDRISHVGIYLGDGKFIHSSSRKRGVIISELSNEFYKTRFVKATRIVGL